MKNKLQNIEQVYKTIGIKKGDIVFIHANMLAFGLIEKNKNDLAKHFIDPLKKVIGETGTIVTLAYSFRYASGTQYIHEESPSEAGLLTEYVRNMKKTERSFHPFASVVANGQDSRHITKNITLSAFGWGSAFFRMHQMKAKCLYLGMTCGESCTFLHYVEQMYGVSHCYNKAFFHPAFFKGKERKGPFLAFLRNRKSKDYDFSRFEKQMKKRKLLKKTKYLGGDIQIMNVEDCFNLGMEMLDKDNCAFLSEPFYVTE